MPAVIEFLNLPPLKPQPLPPYPVIHLAVFICRLAIYKCGMYGCRENMPFKWRPAALIQYVFFAHDRGIFHVHQYQVCMVAFAYVAAPGYLETLRRGVAHLLYHFFQGYTALLHILQHQQQGVLHQGVCLMAPAGKAAVFPARYAGRGRWLLYPAGRPAGLPTARPCFQRLLWLGCILSGCHNAHSQQR